MGLNAILVVACGKGKDFSARWRFYLFRKKVCIQSDSVKTLYGFGGIRGSSLCLSHSVRAQKSPLFCIFFKTAGICFLLED